MWFHGVVLLAATALFSSVNCKATGLTKVNTPKTPVIAPLLSAEAPTQRMLRIDVNSEDGDEARVFDFENELKGLLSKGELPVNVLRMMNEGRRAHDLEDGVVGKLDEYVAKYNNKHNKVESTVGTLTAYYDEAEVAEMIQRGIVSSNPETKDLAEKLSGAQFSNWLRHEKSPLDIFWTLDLVTGYDAFYVMESDAYKAFKRYLDVFNQQNRQGLEFTEYQVFQQVYGSRPLALMIQHALPTGSEAVKNLENAQFRYWDVLDPATDERDVIMRYEDVRYEVFNDRPTPVEEEILGRYMYFLRDEYGISRG